MEIIVCYMKNTLSVPSYGYNKSFKIIFLNICFVYYFYYETYIYVGQILTFFQYKNVFIKYCIDILEFNLN